MNIFKQQLKWFGVLDSDIDFFVRNKLEGIELGFLVENSHIKEFAAFKDASITYSAFDDVIICNDISSKLIGFKGNKMYHTTVYDTKNDSTIEEMWYDENENIIKYIDYKAGKIYRNVYDSKGRMVYSIDNEDIQSFYTYDDHDRLIEFRNSIGNKYNCHRVYEGNNETRFIDSKGYWSRSIYVGDNIEFFQDNNGYYTNDYEYYNNGQLKQYNQLYIPFIE